MSRTILALALAVATVILIASYAFELWVYFTDRGNFARRVALRISYDDNGQQDVPVWDRLLVSYPLFILIFGGLAVCLALDT